MLTYVLTVLQSAAERELEEREKVMAQARKEHEEWVAANRDRMAMLALEAAQKKQEAAIAMLAIEEQARIEADAAVSRVLRSQADEAADKMNREMLAAQQMFARFDAQMADAERAVEVYISR